MLASLHLPFWNICAGAVTGAVIGSFVATLVLRWEQDQSVTKGRSRCDSCGTELKAGDLIPLLSFVWQHGRCRYCRAAIDPFHWHVELMMALIGAAAFAFQPPLHAAGWLALGGLLCALALLDARNLWLPDRLTALLAISGLAAGSMLAATSINDALIGLCVGYASLAVIAFTYRRLRGHEGLGGGDAKLLAGLGAWFGWQAITPIVLAATIGALIWVAVQHLRGHNLNAQTALPLGTFLCLAAVPAWLMSHLSVLF